MISGQPDIEQFVCMLRTRWWIQQAPAWRCCADYWRTLCWCDCLDFLLYLATTSCAKHTIYITATRWMWQGDWDVCSKSVLLITKLIFKMKRGGDRKEGEMGEGKRKGRERRGKELCIRNFLWSNVSPTVKGHTLTQTHTYTLSSAFAYQQCS